MSERQSQSSSFTVLDALGILFVGLKLTCQIDWSWWWVLSPWIAWMVGKTLILYLRHACKED